MSFGIYEANNEVKKYNKDIENLVDINKVNSVNLNDFSDNALNELRKLVNKEIRSRSRNTVVNTDAKSDAKSAKSTNSSVLKSATNFLTGAEFEILCNKKGVSYKVISDACGYAQNVNPSMWAKGKNIPSKKWDIILKTLGFASLEEAKSSL